ncbi:class I adenylate-forming enzyme family protein [Mammaliicoccus stepanovicii]|uniref:Acyl-CoA synthetase n=1 Tax=Mammaliicoccus stepanovicii TaxID=643214 RepID=A0A239YB81_9STAP|nr:AMP-binding protein [Mammaliicoccus stepanovicii]PNZ75481.1 long-chain fatty acid--CoA ligase [Mammaliicoccus stepanovicii]GGI43095.1 long-chain-fatty-acid--CoA ligase [Mammaliicoccus stepanovicii]SNV55962.1 acyl-CoA synthetase [Mammaliicoccus stepanovicii]
MNYDWIKTRAQFDEERTAVIDPLKGTEWTFQELNIRAENLANHLQEQGVKKGDVIGIFSPNDVAVLDLLFAAFKLGAVYFPMNWRLKPNEIESVIADSGVQVIFYAKRHLSSLEGIADEKLHMDIDSSEYDELVNPKKHKPFKSVDVERDDLACLMYTSGTTALPKGVMFTYESFTSNAINSILTYRVNSNFSTVVSLPMFHVFGFNDLTIPLLMAGGKLVLHRYFEGEQFNDLMAQYKPNYLTLIPTMYYALLIAPNFNPKDFENIDFLVQGGSAPLPGVQKKFESMGLNIINGYGLTEAPLGLVNTPENSVKKPMSIGKPVMYVDICLLDEEHNEVEVGEIGELAIKGKQVTPGYWNKPDATKASFHNGYFLTGDLACIDEDGDVFIVDRKKELIITGGENVLPSEVETILSEHPLVAQCVVVGFESEKFGEVVTAGVLLTENDPDYEEKLDAHMREHLASYKVPKLYLQVTKMPLTSTSKPDKLEVKKMMNKKADQLNRD